MLPSFFTRSQGLRKLYCGLFTPMLERRALTQLESDGLAVANRTAGRVVTDDIAAIETIRHRMAKEIVAKFYTAVGELGYSRQEAAALLKEEGSYE